MAPYRFPLEKVLSHKESLKEIQLGKVKEIDLLMEQAENMRLNLEGEIESISRSFCAKSGRELSSGELEGYYRQVRVVISEIDRLTDEIEELSRRRGEEMEILLEIHREIKMLEKLKEKGVTEYKAMEIKKEIGRIDEANVVQYSRKER